jgi:hypothetical protein
VEWWSGGVVEWLSGTLPNSGKLRLLDIFVLQGLLLGRLWALPRRGYRSQPRVSTLGTS